MREEHYKSRLAAFVDRELAAAEQQLVAEHLMKCADCRAEHDKLKLGSTLAQTMVQHDPSPDLWNSIESSLDNNTAPGLGLIPDSSFFGRRGVAGFAVATVAIAAFVWVSYFALFRAETESAKIEQAASEQRSETLQAVNEAATISSNSGPAPGAPNANNVVPDANRVAPTRDDAPGAVLAATDTFRFETLAGKPEVGPASSAGKLAEGDFLETDAASKARIQVADIGNVEIEPNSRVRLIGTDPKQHRLSLERGALEAKIYAPPRLFIVDTPSAVAVDLGCAYRLEVDKAGNSYLHVTSGFVALERGGRESIVPAGAKCITRRGQGLGTPFAADTNERFKAALERFDFANGGSAAVSEMLGHRSHYDIITLWHLLSRAEKTDRERIFDALAVYVAPPKDVTKEGVLALKKPMLESWKEEVERTWFE